MEGLALESRNESVVVNGTLMYQVVNNGAEILQAKLGLAMAVTFAVGCVQVGAVLRPPSLLWKKGEL